MANLGSNGEMQFDRPLFKSVNEPDSRLTPVSIPNKQSERPGSTSWSELQNQGDEVQSQKALETTTPVWSRGSVPGKPSDTKSSEARPGEDAQDTDSASGRWVVQRYSRGEVFAGQTGRRREHKGVGLLKVSPTHAFVGEWEADRYQGCGLLQTAGHAFHLGMFVRSQTDGPGISLQPEAKFVGSFRGGLREGPGEETTSGRTLRGYWQTGLLEGFGELQAGGFKRQGFWVQGMSQGACVETQGEFQFVGHLHKGLKHGPGVLFKGGSLMSAAVYWRGQADGYAQMRDSDSQTLFEGIFVQGVKEGPGTTTNTLGKEQLFAEYSKDQLHGLVVKTKTGDPKDFLGYYKHGKPDGLCLEKGQGWCFFGHYKDGVKHGWGYENKGGREFTGRYVNGKQQGLALLQLPGVQPVGGEFQSGKLVNFSKEVPPLEFKDQLPAIEDFMKRLHDRIASLRLTLQESKNKWSLPNTDAIRRQFEDESQKLSFLIKSTTKSVGRIREVVHGQLKWVQKITKGSSIELGIDNLFRGLRLSDAKEFNFGFLGDISEMEIPLEALGMPVMDLNPDASQTHFTRWNGPKKAIRSPEAPLNKSISAVMAQNPNASLAEWMDVFTLEGQEPESKEFHQKRLEEIFPPRSPEKREAQTGDIIIDEDYLARDAEISMLHMREIPGREFEEGVSFFRIEPPTSRPGSQQKESTNRSSTSRENLHDQELIEISDMGDAQESNKNSLDNSPDTQPISIHAIQQPLKSIPEEAVEEGSEQREKGFYTVSHFGTRESDIEGDSKRNPLLLFKRDLALYSKIIDDIKLTPRPPTKPEYKTRIAPGWARESYPELGEKSGSSFSMMSNQVDFQIEDVNPRLLETSQDSTDALFQAFNEEN